MIMKSFGKNFNPTWVSDYFNECLRLLRQAFTIVIGGKQAKSKKWKRRK